MPTRTDVVGEQLDELRQDLKQLWTALTSDPKQEARKERAWTMLAGALGAASTMAARRATAKLWAVLTGEQPPTARPASTNSGSAQTHELHEEARR
jgi:hypothetical protein